MWATRRANGAAAEGAVSDLWLEDLKLRSRIRVASKPILWRPTIDGSLISWTQASHGAPEQPMIVVKDTANNHVLLALPLHETEKEMLGEYVLCGRFLVYRMSLLASGTEGRIIAVNVDTGAIRTVARGQGLGALASGDGLIGWSAYAQDRGLNLVYACRLNRGRPFLVAETEDAIAAIAISEKTVAWLSGNYPENVIETCEIP